jgi:hypothetical protein
MYVYIYIQKIYICKYKNMYIYTHTNKHTHTHRVFFTARTRPTRMTSMTWSYAVGIRRIYAYAAYTCIYLDDVGIRRIYLNVYGANKYIHMMCVCVCLCVCACVCVGGRVHARGIRHIYAAARTRSIRMTSLMWAYAAYLPSELVVRLL